MKARPILMDSSFVIDLLNEIDAKTPGAAFEWLRRNPKAKFWISPVTWAEVLEGAEDAGKVRNFMSSFQWQGIHHTHAEAAAKLQRRASKRMGENDAWQAAIALCMGGIVLGHDPKAFTRLGDAYVDHRA